MKLTFVTKSDANSGFAAANPSRLVNLYPEPLPAGSRASHQLRSVLGSEAWAEIGGVFLRALATVNGFCYAVSGGRLWEVAQSGAFVSRGEVDDSAETTISGNDGKVTVVAGGKYYVWDGVALTQPTAGAFEAFGSHDMLGGYTLATELGGNRLQWSALYNAASLPGLNFSPIEQRQGNLTRVMAINGNAVLFKAESFEVWGGTGQANESAFQWLGITRQIGLKSFGLIAKTRQGAFFVGHDNRLYMHDGGEASPFSTPAVEYDIANGEPTECLYYEDEGHQFAVLRFRNRPAWVCDLSYGGAWHERASGDGPWSVQHSTFAYGAWRAGGQGGVVYRLKRNNEDAGGVLRRVAVSVPAHEGPLFTVALLEFFGDFGENPLPREPAMVLELSKDNGKTWGRERDRGLGGLGEYETRVNFKALGQFRSMVARVTITDPVDVRLLTTADVSVT
jgi:hypothetical protein